MTDDMTECLKKTYRVTVFLNNGAKVMFNTRSEETAGRVRRKFSFENLKNNTPIEIRGLDEQKLIFVPSSISMVISEEVHKGIEYFNDPLERFVYHSF